MSEGNTLVSVLIKRDGDHVMSQSEEHQAISNYFVSDEFVAYAANEEVDSDLLVKISEGLTNYVRQSDDPALVWASNATVVCTNAKTGDVEGTNDNAVMFSLDVNTGE